MIQLSAAFAGFPAGTILLARSSIPADLSTTQIDLYASTNSSLTWMFVCHIAAGGKAVGHSSIVFDAITDRFDRAL
jgi:hypothetical protein